MSPDQCGCGSKFQYLQCCGLYHIGRSYPETAEKLMRSRYCAFTRELLNYLIDTHHPAYFSPAEITSLQRTFKQCKWRRLEIIRCHKGGREDTNGTVLFRAVYEEGGKEFAMEENSFFSKVGDKWVYQEAL